MSDTPETPASGGAGPHRSHTNPSMDGIELFYLRNLASMWQQLAAVDRAAFVSEYVWLRNLHRKMDEAAKDETNEKATRRWKIGIGVAVAGLLFTGINAFIEYSVAGSHQAAAQNITVKLPSGQSFTVTPAPTPTGGAP